MGEFTNYKLSHVSSLSPVLNVFNLAEVVRGGDFLASGRLDLWHRHSCVLRTQARRCSSKAVC